MKLDFSETKETKNSTVGTHSFEITKAEEKKSQNGTNMFVICAKDEEEGFICDRVCTEGPGAFRMKQFLGAVGVSEEEAAGMEASDFVGMTFDAEIVSEDYEGEERAKIKKFLKA